jgi:hypothetical protein
MAPPQTSYLCVKDTAGHGCEVGEERAEMGATADERQDIETTYISSQYVQSLHRHVITHLHLAMEMERVSNC